MANKKENAIKDLGEFKFSAIESFRGILHATVKDIDRNRSADPRLGRGQSDRGLECSRLLRIG